MNIEPTHISARVKVNVPELADDTDILDYVNAKAGRKLAKDVLDTDYHWPAPFTRRYAVVALEGSPDDVMAALLIFGQPTSPQPMWRYRFAHLLMKLGLKMMPPGRPRAELTAMMWTWNMKVQATLAVHQGKELNNG